MSTGKKRYPQSVQTAYDAVNGLHMDEQYKLTAFRLILQQELECISSLQRHSPTGGDVTEKRTATDQGSWQHKIASSLGISDEDVLEIYHYTEDDDIELVIEKKDVPSVAAKATKQIAMLYAGGRQAAGIENATSIDAIRNVCENGYKVVDKKNFSTNINGLGAKFRIEGSGTERTVQLVNGAYRAVGEIAKHYLGEKK